MSSIGEKIFSFFSNLYNKSEENKCSICLEDNNKNKILLDCGHYYHVLCIQKWKLRNDSCPICRQKISMEKYSQNKKKSFLRIILLISVLIFFLSLPSGTRTHSGIKKIAQKIYYLNKEIFRNLYDIVKSVLYIFGFVIKEIYLIIKQSGIIIGKNFIRTIKIIYHLIALVLIILLSSLMIIVNAIIDIMNLIITIDEILFKII